MTCVATGIIATRFTSYTGEVPGTVLARSRIMSLFADDMALYKPIKFPADYWRLQLDITTLVDWIKQRLSLQPSKCCCVLIPGKKKFATNQPPPPFMCQEPPCCGTCKKCSYIGLLCTPPTVLQVLYNLGRILSVPYLQKDIESLEKVQRFCT